MSEKNVIFVQNSIINCVYHKRHKHKLSTSLHAVFRLIFWAMYTLSWLFLIFVVKKMRFSESRQNSIFEKLIFGHFEVLFRNLRVWLFFVSKVQDEYFSEKMSSLAGLKKNYSIFRKSTDVGHF